MKKRILGLLVLCLVIALVTGCGNTNNSSNGATRNRVMYQSNERDEALEQIEILTAYDDILESKSLDSKKIGKVYMGEIYTVISITEDNGKWIEIETAHKLHGYILWDDTLMKMLSKSDTTNTVSNTTIDNNENNQVQNPTTNNGNENNQVQNTSQQNTQSSNTTVSISKQNALKSAKSYLSFMAFSKEGLIEQLEYEKYPHEDAVYAAENCGADWNEQALKSAKSYLKTSAFSYSGLIEQLEYEGYTSEQAIYGVNNCGANWNEQAVKSAKSYLSFSAFSHDGLVEQLEYEGFTHEQAEYGVTQNGL